VGGEYRNAPPWGLARLGADLTKDTFGRWVVGRVAQGATWYPREATPLLAPGVGIKPGTVILAVNGQPVDPATGPGPLLTNQASLSS
jgi:tricorn protease